MDPARRPGAGFGHKNPYGLRMATQRARRGTGGPQVGPFNPRPCLSPCERPISAVFDLFNLRSGVGSSEWSEVVERRVAKG